LSFSKTVTGQQSNTKIASITEVHHTIHDKVEFLPTLDVDIIGCRVWLRQAVHADWTMKHKTQWNRQTERGCRQTMAATAAAAGKQVKNN